MEKVKASEGKMKKYRDLYEVEKQRYKEALQRHQEDHMDEVEIINLHKRCTKADRKTAAKTGTKADRKQPQRQIQKQPQRLLGVDTTFF